MSKTYPSKDGYIRSVQFDVGDVVFLPDGKKTNPVSRFDRLVNKDSHKLIMMVSAVIRG